MMAELEGWLTTDEAARVTGYSFRHLRRLAREGSIEARKVGRDWLIKADSLGGYQAKMDAMGAEKHNPWRGDLAEKGRGRGGEDVQGEQ